MTIQDLISSGIDIQSEVVYCYYDYTNNERVEISKAEALVRGDIHWIYTENDRIYIELESED